MHIDVINGLNLSGIFRPQARDTGINGKEINDNDFKETDKFKINSAASGYGPVAGCC
jgi:hypothetical protein